MRLRSWQPRWRTAALWRWCRGHTPSLRLLDPSLGFPQVRSTALQRWVQWGVGGWQASAGLRQRRIISTSNLQWDECWCPTPV
ncbi:hypothetical protein B0J18DRAFT_426739 [Chaetomium sp. MPI-SDFR-AT-0129]|nr:hypothetical protein B0J18DRAFT_426739 [Chaetomium sp. MPI-SDFR-AT-0129]